MVTFVGDTAPKPETKIEGFGNSVVGEIKLKSIREENQRDGRHWLTFPLWLDWEQSINPNDPVWTKVYPRVIQWTNGKYYTFAGTHSKHNEVYYKEILVEMGEKIAYYTYMG